MSGAEEEWVKAAMIDDTMVVEILVRLYHTPPPRPPRPKPASFSLEWSVRQRRSKYVSVTNNPKKLAHRGSPTTPLSWSGATSFSGGSAGAGGAGSEESSQPVPLKRSTPTRSKVNVDGEKITSSKRSRKKKTLAELKDEENLLLKERRELKREMVLLRMNLERQRARNENLKRMKIEMQPRLASELKSAAEESVSGQSKHDSTACHPIIDAGLQSSESNDENADKETNSEFILPDLNVPFDEPSFGVCCGIS